MRRLFSRKEERIGAKERRGNMEGQRRVGKRREAEKRAEGVVKEILWVGGKKEMEQRKVRRETIQWRLAPLK